MSGRSYFQQSIILNEKHLIKDKLRWDKVKAPKLYQHPHDCIGWIIVSPKNGSSINGTGFLISPRLILTSAHTFQLIKDEKMYLPNVDQISFYIMEANKQQPIQIAVKSIRVPLKYQTIINEINQLRVKRDRQKDPLKRDEINRKIQQLHHKEMQNDFALLQLEQQITRSRYFELPQNIISFPIPQLAVSGYVQDYHTGQYRHFTHFEVLAQIKYGAAFYDIDTQGGQSGAPAYLIYGDRVTLIGIHKGYSREDNLNYCTMITQEVITTLQKWIGEIKNLSVAPFVAKGISKIDAPSKSQLFVDDFNQLDQNLKILNNQEQILQIRKQYQMVCEQLRGEISAKDAIILKLRQQQELSSKKLSKSEQEANKYIIYQLEGQNDELRVQIDQLKSQRQKLKEQIVIKDAKLKKITEQASQKFRQLEMMVNDSNQIASKIQDKFKKGYNPNKIQQFGDNQNKQGISLQILGYGYEKLVAQLRKVNCKQVINSLVCINTCISLNTQQQMFINAAYYSQYPAVSVNKLRVCYQLLSCKQIKNLVRTKKFMKRMKYEIQKVIAFLFRWLIIKYLDVTYDKVRVIIQIFSGRYLFIQSQIIYSIRSFPILRSFTLWIKHSLQKSQSFDKFVLNLNSMKLESVEIYIRHDRKIEEQYDWTKDIFAGQVKKQYLEW